MGETTLSELSTETGQMERNGAIIDGKQPHWVLKGALKKSEKLWSLTIHSEKKPFCLFRVLLNMVNNGFGNTSDIYSKKFLVVLTLADL